MQQLFALKANKTIRASKPLVRIQLKKGFTQNLRVLPYVKQYINICIGFSGFIDT